MDLPLAAFALAGQCRTLAPRQQRLHCPPQVAASILEVGVRQGDDAARLPRRLSPGDDPLATCIATTKDMTASSLALGWP